MNQAREAWETFFFSRTQDGLGGVIRILYVCLCFLNMALLGLDLPLYFTESGTLPLAASRAIVDSDTFTVFSILPLTDSSVWAIYTIMMIQILMLGLGLWPRLQAAGVFFWLGMFHHRHIILFDGEDVAFRLLAFLLIFFPLHRYTVVELFRGRSPGGTWPLWPFRLMQIQMCLIFLSTVMLKFGGREWWDGTAMFYVIHLDDLYGKVFNPPLLFNHLLSLKLMTWSTLVLEAVAPLTIWFKKTRRPTLLVLIVFHLGIDLSMNLNLFHWIMITGWLSFLAQPMIERPNEPLNESGSGPAPHGAEVVNG
jgi:hypothetical protein